MDTIQLVLLLAIPFFLVYATRQAMRQAAHKQAAWRRAAERLGLEPDPTTEEGLRPILQGTIDGHGVEIEAITRGGGKSSVTYTVFRSRFPGSVPAGLSLTRATFASELRSTLGSQDIPLADKRLDRTLLVQGSHPAAIQSLLDRGPVRKALRRFFRNDRYSRVEGRDIIADRKGFLTGDELDEMLEATIAVITAVTRVREQAWTEIAARHALTYQAIGPAVRLTGERAGAAVRIETWDGQSTQLTIEIPRLARQVRISPGGGGFATRDPILGGRVCIIGPPTVLSTWFGPTQLDELRGDLLQVFETWPDATVQDGKLNITLAGEPYQSLDAVLGDLCMLADALGRVASD